MPERPARLELLAHPPQAATEPGELVADRLRANPGELARVCGGGDQVPLVLIARDRDEPVGGDGADAAVGGLHGPAERLRVDRVGHERQVGERVADLGALIQPKASEHPVRNPRVPERALDRGGGVAGAGEHQDLGRRHTAGERVGRLAGDPLRLVAL